MMKNLLFLIALLLGLSSCVSKKELLMVQEERDGLQMQLEQARADLDYCQNINENLRAELRAKEDLLISKEGQIASRNSMINSLEQQLEYVKSTNTNLLDRLSDLAVVSKSGAESIQRSLETLNRQNEYIQGLTSGIQARDSLNLALVMNLKRSLANFDDEDIQIEVKKGVVYISISDKMLFRSGSHYIRPRAEEVLGKVARIIKDHQNLEVLVEGHTDNVPIYTECLRDNWDLSVMRATAVVRLLQTKYSVTPQRMTAGGRSEFIPKATNETAEGRQLNRRTEIILTPKLEEFFELLTPPEM